MDEEQFNIACVFPNIAAQIRNSLGTLHLAAAQLAPALERERGQQHPKYREMCRRFLADEQDFSQEKLAKAEIDRRFVNEEADRTQEEIASYIMSLRRTS